MYGPQSMTRLNLFNSTKITAAIYSGYSTGDGIPAVNEVAKTLPKDYTTAYSRLSREEVNAGSQSTTIFILSLVFVYFLLAAQYESYLVPIAIFLSLPLGLLAKNAILIVEFALQCRRQGEFVLEAALDGAKSRLRPILMTSFAFIFGILSLVFANGVGAAGNRSIGAGAIGGLLIGTVFGGIRYSHPIHSLSMAAGKDCW